MNVAFVSNVVHPFVAGGAQKRIHEVGRRLVERGHDVTVYGRHYWDGPRVTDQRGMTLRAVAPARDLYAGDRRSIREAVDFAVRLGPPLYRRCGEHDVVVASVFPYFPVFTAAGCAARAGVPLVATWHECWREYWTTYLGRLGHAGRAVERLAATVPQHPVAVSAVTADRLAAIGPDRSDVAVVPNGIDLDRIRDARPAEAGYDVLFVGRLVPEKNADLLLRALAGQDAAPSVGIVGEGPERERLGRLADTLGLDDRVDFLGRLPDEDDVIAHLRAAPVFAVPSTREGFGISFLEAMAAGCTVVAAAHPRSAASEVVADAGFVVEPTVDALSSALAAAIAGERPAVDPVERAARYDWDAVAEAAEAAYRDAIDG